METKTKRELVKTISERLAMPNAEVAAVIQGFMDQLVEELASGNRLEFREFGIFDLKQRRARKARNPRSGEKVMVPSKTVVVFKAGKEMKLQVDIGATPILRKADESKPPKAAGPRKPGRPKGSKTKKPTISAAAPTEAES